MLSPCSCLFSGFMRKQREEAHRMPSHAMRKMLRRIGTSPPALIESDCRRPHCYRCSQWKQTQNTIRPVQICSINEARWKDSKSAGDLVCVCAIQFSVLFAAQPDISTFPEKLVIEAQILPHCLSLFVMVWDFHSIYSPVQGSSYDKLDGMYRSVG